MLFFPYHPEIVVYHGENGFGFDEKAHAATVANRFVRLFGLIPSKMPIAPLAFISMKPSPSQMHLAGKMKAVNLITKSIRHT